MFVNEYRLEIQFKKVWKVQNINNIPMVGSRPLGCRPAQNVCAERTLHHLSVTYLNLSCSQTSNGLVRLGWELLYYSHGEMEKVVTSSQGEVAFVTEFNGKKCLLKVSH